MEHNEIALAGRITADLTHEMKNVLAILKESAGLMRDILNLTKGLDFPRKDKFETALSMCEKHLPRGLDVTNRLNRFAHSADEPAEQVDLGTVVKLAADVMARRASLQKLGMEADVPRKPATTYGFPLRMVLTVAAMANALIEAPPAGAEKITLSLEAKRGRAVIRAMAGPLPKGTEPDIPLPEIDEALAAMQGALTVEHARKQSGLRLEAPLREAPAV